MNNKNEMIIKLDIEELEHIKERSYYDHNFYKLPFMLIYNDIECNILYEEYDEQFEEAIYAIGYIDENKFVNVMQFGYSPEGEIIFKNVELSDYC